VERGDPKAVSYIEALGNAYRYVLSAGTRRLVTLADELGALERHRLLTSLRYGDAVRIVSDIAPELAAGWSLPPVSLGELLTNAFKHNAISRERPIALHLTLDGNRLIVENDVRPIGGERPTAGLGLTNLAERHRLATGLIVSWALKDGVFRVEIPLSRWTEHPPAG
jgi:LytS/YehU family sensor histidine kinase